jgi:hypothetical protein
MGFSQAFELALVATRPTMTIIAGKYIWWRPWWKRRRFAACVGFTLYSFAGKSIAPHERQLYGNHSRPSYARYWPDGDRGERRRRPSTHLDRTITSGSYLPSSAGLYHRRRVATLAN